MTRPFSPRIKYRILVAHGALVLVGGTLVPIAHVVYGTLSETKRFAIVKRAGAAVRCACGCDVWATLAEIQFDHAKAHVSGGLTSIGNGRPLRARPCHAAKSAAEQAVTGKITSVRRKLSVTLGLKPRDDTHQPRPSVRWRRAWPARSLSNPSLKRRFDGRVVRA